MCCVGMNVRVLLGECPEYRTIRADFLQNALMVFHILKRIVKTNRHSS